MSSTFRIGDFTLDPNRNLLSSDEETTRLEPIATEVLRYLAERSDRVVTREELYESVWDGAAVTDEVLTVTVGKLRKAFGDDTKDPRYIKTVPKRGYRLVAPVSLQGPSRPGMRRGPAAVAVLLLLVGLGAAVWRITRPTAPSIESLVILPTRIPGESDPFLADAIPDWLSSRLHPFPGIDILRSPREAELARLEGDIEELASLYDASAVVQTSLAVDGETWRLNLRLTESGTRRQIWSREFVSSESRYLDMVEEAAYSLRAALSPTMDATELSEPRAYRPEAEMAFQEGAYYTRQYNNRREEDDFARARASLERALELEPDLADAAAEMAWLYLFKNSVALREEVDTWAARALEIEPRNGRAWLAVLFKDRTRPEVSYRQRLEAALRAATFDPRDEMSHFLLGSALSQTTIALSEEALYESFRQNPLYAYSALAAVGRFYFTGRDTEGIELVNHVLTRIDPGIPYALMYKGLFLAGEGRAQEVEEVLESLQRAAQENRAPPGAEALVRHALAVEQNDDEAARKARSRFVSEVIEGEGGVAGKAGFTALMLRSLRDTKQFEAATDLTQRLEALGHVPPLEGICLFGAPAMREREQFPTTLARARERFEETLEILDAARARQEFPPYLEEPLQDVLRRLDEVEGCRE